MNMVNLKINNIDVSVPAGSTILQAAKSANIEIPTLCYMKEINEIGACRICVVEVKGARSLVASCVYPVNEGMEVFTSTPRVLKARRMTLELLLSNHNRKCLSCIRSGSCELQALCNEYGVDNDGKYDGAKTESEIDDSAAHMYRDNSKCILCRRCVAVCEKNQAVSVIGANERGFATHVGSPFEALLDETSCVSCGQCIVNCPTGALSEKDSTAKVWEALSDDSKHVIVQTAPAVRAAIAEEFGNPIGTDGEGKMVAALRRLGFDGVYDTDIAADLTIIEEANELVERIQNGGKLPMITSCSPGWIKFCEYNFPDLLDNLSTCKSPQQMFGALAKTWYADKMGIDPKDIYVVSVMPCTAKKFEIGREDEDAAGVPDVDAVITTRELARMIKRAGINFNGLADEEFDMPLGSSTGAGVIFGATGGVMEAALRTAVETITGKELGNFEFTEVRGMEGIKEASYEVGGLNVKVAVASGLANAKELMKKVQKGEADYQFIEIMACPGGCVNGGGQPIQPASVRNFDDVRGKRAAVLYNIDKNMPLRKSHDNPVLKEAYAEYFGKPGSHKAHKAFHTTYVKRSRFGTL
ncbi:MAG: iron hydrogenase small subunit [Clostridia bacterium]|nr:iron hydrogenase small subunit [Clostridia bacterium]